MKEQTCIVIGGGYAGIHAIKSILKASQEGSKTQRIRVILIDKQPYHLRKVLLFKQAAHGTDIRIPFQEMFSQDVHFLQGAVTMVESMEKRIRYVDAERVEHLLNYDILVVAVGSVVRQPDAGQGGIALTGVEAAANIRERRRENLRKAASETDASERQRLMTVAVAGAGISGIETSAELAHTMRAEAIELGLDPDMIRIYLVNAQDRLFPEGPVKLGSKLERSLEDCGVKILHQVKVLHEKDGTLNLSNGESLSVGLCVWTLGLLPNPMLRGIGLPLTPEGQVVVDACYRVQDAPGVYSIGDCARILDPSSGRPDRMTCKEATVQAARLGKIVAADLAGRAAPSHQGYMTFYCFGLGPERGMVWTRQWGLDIIVTGKLGWKIRKFAWDMASFVKS